MPGAVKEQALMSTVIVCGAGPESPRPPKNSGGRNDLAPPLLTIVQESRERVLGFDL